MATDINIANEIKQQLYAMDANLMCGMAAKEFIAGTDEQGQTWLRFHVHGIKHNGLVKITLDESADLYNLEIYTVRRTQNDPMGIKKIKYHNEGIFVDQLPEIIEKECY